MRGWDNRFLHRFNSLFAERAPFLRAPQVGAHQARAGVKPATQSWVVHQASRFTRELDENQLRNILCVCRVAMAFAASHGIDEVNVSLDKLGKRRLVALRGVSSQ